MTVFKIQNMSSLITYNPPDIDSGDNASSLLTLGESGTIVTSPTYTLDLTKTLTIFDTSNNSIIVTLPNGTTSGQVIVLLNSTGGGSLTLNGNIWGGINMVNIATTVSYFWSSGNWFPFTYWNFDG